jgi:hypothetical protein
MHDLEEKQRCLSGAARPGEHGDIGIQIRLDHALRREARSVEFGRVDPQCGERRDLGV